VPSTASADNKTAIQNAINAAAAATAGVGGGTVEIPGPGTYLCGPLTMKKKVNLQVDAGATLQMLPMTNWSGTTTFIYGSSLNDIEFSGAGTIDGNGADWWTAFRATACRPPQFHRVQQDYAHPLSGHHIPKRPHLPSHVEGQQL